MNHKHLLQVLGSFRRSWHIACGDPPFQQKLREWVLSFCCGKDSYFSPTIERLMIIYISRLLIIRFICVTKVKKITVLGSFLQDNFLNIDFSAMTNISKQNSRRQQQLQGTLNGNYLIMQEHTMTNRNLLSSLRQMEHTLANKESSS